MESSTEHDAYRSAPPPPSQETSEHRIANIDVRGQSQTHYQSPAIRQLVSIFLANVKSRFGEDSSEVMAIWSILGAFRAGKKSKKDTIITINQALGHHKDLRQDLIKVLYHPGAKWQTGDFEFEPHQPMHSPTPNFLQPVHQPQIRLPPMTWFEKRQAYPAISSGYYPSWSPVVPKLELNHTESPSVPGSDMPACPHQSHTPQAGFLERELSETDGLPVLGVPVAVDVGQTANDMPPPLNKRRRGASEEQALQEATDAAISGATEQFCLSATDMDRRVAKRQSESTSKAKHSQAESTKPFIHGLCGRGFGTRSKVKKHHWGNVLNDVKTTTGCWAKHGKPNVSWNDHPSCTEGVKASGHARTTPAAMEKDEPRATPHLMAPMTPAPDEGHEAVARSANLDEDDQEASQDRGQHHSHRLPNRSSFDTLLSAVKVASEMDAWNPQGRIDSVVGHIDGQAAAVEDTRQYVVDWQNTVWGHDEEAAAASGYPHPYTTLQPSMMYPPRGYHVPVEVALPFYARPRSHTPQMYPCPAGNWIDDQSSMMEGAYSSPAPLEPPFPDAYTGSRPT